METQERGLSRVEVEVSLAAVGGSGMDSGSMT